MTDELANVVFSLQGDQIANSEYGLFVSNSARDTMALDALKQLTHAALQNDQISLSDVIGIYNSNSLADTRVKLQKAERENKQQQAQMQEQQMQAQMQMQAQQAQAQLESQKIQMESQAKIQYRQADVAFEIEKMKNEAELKRQLMQTEFEFQMQIKGMEQTNLSQREQNREKAKDDRVSLQSTEQSKLIKQRKNNLPPINFESNEDSLDGFDLAEFEPR